MGRSLKVRKEYLGRARLALKHSGLARQKDLAEELEMALSTVSNYLTGRPVSVQNFNEISDRLGLDPPSIADWPNNDELPSPNSEGDSFIEEDPFIYVDRPPVETACYEAILKPNSLVRIKAPGLMGKTSLVVKILKQFKKKEGCSEVYLNLHFADKTDFSSLNQFLRWFCVSVGQSLGLPNLLADQWDEQFSTPKINCNTYFEKNFLSLNSSALILCLDEVDRIFPYRELASEFLGLLRAWHEQAKTKEIWKKLRLIVVHSTEAYTPLNINESPFNVGLPIDLPDFTLEQIQTFAFLHGLDWIEDQGRQLMERVNGHPYLVEQALSHLKNNPAVTLNEFLQIAPTEAGIYRNHLRHLKCMLEKRPELMAALAEVVSSDRSIYLGSEQTAYQLVSMGVVRFAKDNRVLPRCNLYRQFFRERPT
jgi:transcriptional regulator with XRE-family HTH domain